MEQEGLQKLHRDNMIFHVYKKHAISNVDSVVGIMLNTDEINEKLNNGEISLDTHEIEELTYERLEGSY